MNEIIESIDYKGVKINVYQDSDAEYSPEDWNGDDMFLVNYHNDFDVRRDKIITKEEVIAWYRVDEENYPKEQEKKYHILGLEAYIHSGVVLALSDEGNFPDRRWDVSRVGVVLVNKEEAKSKEKAKKLARGLIESWNNCLSGNIYGYRIETEGGEIGGCWGFYGDYDKSGLIEKAKSEADEVIKELKKELKEEQKIKIAEKELTRLKAYKENEFENVWYFSRDWHGVDLFEIMLLATNNYGDWRGSQDNKVGLKHRIYLAFEATHKDDKKLKRKLESILPLLIDLKV